MDLTANQVVSERAALFIADLNAQYVISATRGLSIQTITKV